VVEAYGAFDISLINDLPLFIDPFLLFDSTKPEYKALHEEIIRYVKPLEREADLQIMFRLTWHGSPLDVNREVNNGRGPVDFKISHGAANATLVEFKLASNRKLEQNLKHQVATYEAATRTKAMPSMAARSRTWSRPATLLDGM